MQQKWWQSYIQFHAKERLGIVALTALLLLLIIFYSTIPYWIHPPAEHPYEQLAAAFRSYIETHRLPDPQEEPPADSIFTGTMFPFDPNTLDSGGFARLGLRPKTIHLLLNWRKKGKQFYEKEDLKPLYTLKEAEYNRLAPYIRIQISREQKPFHFPAYEAPPASVDLNRTDSATLVRLRGIGPTLASKIIKKRNALGGFLKHEQLNEIYHFPDTTFAMLREKLLIDPAGVKKISLNEAGAEILQSHPYIGEKLARNIIIYREGLKSFQNINQLRQVPLMNEEIYRKIAPYFTLY
ncbi:MAG: hypothetical protein EOP49_34305 [Sphingobacteriales bacterium]|nr:MAG: hypothetical protein EOP49_34305 [Sphingobacteriales bacterium]